MRIGIDISQIVYEGTGVGTYVRKMTEALIRLYPYHEYILFGSSLRKRKVFEQYFNDLNHLSKHIRLVTVPIPPIVLDALWNRLHIVPIEAFIGNVDVFWSSDWTQPPLQNSVGVTTIHDVSVMRYPEESHNQTNIHLFRGVVSPNIVATQKRRLSHAVQQCQVFFCDSEATKRDIVELLGISKQKLVVVYPGL